MTHANLYSVLSEVSYLFLYLIWFVTVVADFDSFKPAAFKSLYLVVSVLIIVHQLGPLAALVLQTQWKVKDQLLTFPVLMKSLRGRKKKLVFKIPIASYCCKSVADSQASEPDKYF